MYIIEVKSRERKVHLVDDGKCHLKGHLNDVPKTELSNKTPILLLDDDHYFNLLLRDELINKELVAREIIPKNIISPVEAIAAYASIQYKQYDDFYLVTLRSENVSGATFTFIDGKYMLKRYSKSIEIDFKALISKHLSIDYSQVDAFELFLREKNPHGDDASNEQVVLEAINQLISNQYLDPIQDGIISIFDNNHLWKHIRIYNLVSLKNEILSAINVGNNKKVIFLGHFHNLFNGIQGVELTSAGVLGAAQIGSQKENIYSNLPYTIALQVYCYPKMYEVPVYEAQCPYIEYYKPKKIKLFNTGRLTFLINEKPVQLEMKRKTEVPELMEITVRLDGNQNLFVTVGRDQYLLDTHE